MFLFYHDTKHRYTFTYIFISLSYFFLCFSFFFLSGLSLIILEFALRIRHLRKAMDCTGSPLFNNLNCAYCISNQIQAEKATLRVAVQEVTSHSRRIKQVPGVQEVVPSPAAGDRTVSSLENRRCASLGRTPEFLLCKVPLHCGLVISH